MTLSSSPRRSGGPPGSNATSPGSADARAVARLGDGAASDVTTLGAPALELLAERLLQASQGLRVGPLVRLLHARPPGGALSVCKAGIWGEYVTGRRSCQHVPHPAEARVQ